MRSLGWTLIQNDGCSYKRKKLETDTHRGKAVERNREKMAIYKPGREAWTQPALTAPRGPNSANTLILAFWTPERRDNPFLLFGAML